MERFQPVLLKVWREACRQIELAQSVPTIMGLLGEDLPVVRLLVRRGERGSDGLETVADVTSSGIAVQQEGRSQCTAGDLERLQRWCRRGEVVCGSGRAERSTAWRVAVPRGVDADVLAGPLGDPDGVWGILILVAAPGRAFEARQAQLARALLEPLSVALVNDHQVRALDARRAAAEAQRTALLARLGRTELADTIVGAQTGLRGVLQRVDLVARSAAPVLLFGETGTGKELIARTIHERSPVAAGPIIRVNCGAIPPELIDSELFGHERGAFTGAVEMRRGWFERADGGTLFLDEIGELPLAAQVRLLRILQDGWLQRVGGERPIQVQVRVVAATHQDLPRMVAEGCFREDLWYRISVFPIVLPPLRERRSDIAALADHFAERAAVRFGLPVVRPTREDQQLLAAYDWPGNVRELAAVLDRATLLGNGRCLDVATALGITTPAPARGPTPSSPPEPSRSEPALASLDDVVRRHIETVLARTRGRVEGPFGAATQLQVNPHTLRARMRKLGVDWRRFRAKS